MKRIRLNLKYVCLVMTALTVLLSIPPQSAFAAMVNTQTVLSAQAQDDAQASVKAFLARDDVRAFLVARGVDPMEAETRVASLTNEEIQELSQQIENLPAGGDGVGLVVAVLLIVLLVIVILRLV